VFSGGRVSAAGIAALAHVCGGDAAAAEALVAQRCWQLLCSWAPLLEDLKLLSEDSELCGDEGLVTYYGSMLQQYTKVCPLDENAWG
jgi:hypothetical protein